MTSEEQRARLSAEDDANYASFLRWRERRDTALAVARAVAAGLFGWLP